MSLPPPPNPYGGQPSYGGQPPYGGQPQWGGQQPAGVGAGEGQFSGPPPWGGPPQQPQWGGPPPGPPPGKGGKGKWILGGVILLLVIALAVTITVLVVKPDSNGPSATPTTNGADSEFASANDTGAVNIITEDPTCDAWGRVVRTYADETRAVGWEKRDPSIPASSWSPEQRSMYESVGDAMLEASEQAGKLAKTTPHRVMREMYQQLVSYANAFTSKIDAYRDSYDALAVVTDTLATAASHICSSIEYRRAQAVAPLVPAPPAPKATAAVNASDRFLTAKISTCDDWTSTIDRFDQENADWLALDPKISAKDWTPEQRAINEATRQAMSQNADTIERLGRDSDNPILDDFATLAAQYRRAFAVAIPQYVSADGFLAESATALVRTVNWACKAAE